MNDPFLSICIPSYNRPFELGRLLASIDTPEKSLIQIVICEDKSPKRHEIREKVKLYIGMKDYDVLYIENEVNYGYDRNLRELIKHSDGEYIVFMGDDDEFVPNGIDRLISFLQINKTKDIGYLMKTHLMIHPDNNIELFKYFQNDIFFEPGPDTYVKLYRRSVFISGFTFKREYALPYLTDRFDGTLLFQLYLLSELTLKYRAAYFSEPIVQQYKGGIPYFGSSKSEKEKYDIGQISIRNSVNFMKGFFEITRFIDQKYNLNSTERIRMEISKYSYPVLAVQRNKGLINFIKYLRELKVIKINCSIYYYINVIGLIILGENMCNKIIIKVKKLIGRTPIL